GQRHGHARAALVILGWFPGKGSQQPGADRRPRREVIILGDIADARAAPERARAGVGFVAASQQAQQRRFAGAVRPNQTAAMASAARALRNRARVRRARTSSTVLANSWRAAHTTSAPQ